MSKALLATAWIDEVNKHKRIASVLAITLRELLEDDKSHSAKQRAQLALDLWGGKTTVEEAISELERGA
jgi:hypothetical protein